MNELREKMKTILCKIVHDEKMGVLVDNEIGSKDIADRELRIEAYLDELTSLVDKPVTQTPKLADIKKRFKERFGDRGTLNEEKICEFFTPLLATKEHDDKIREEAEQGVLELIKNYHIPFNRWTKKTVVQFIEQFIAERDK